MKATQPYFLDVGTQLRKRMKNQYVGELKTTSTFMKMHDILNLERTTRQLEDNLNVLGKWKTTPFNFQ